MVGEIKKVTEVTNIPDAISPCIRDCTLSDLSSLRQMMYNTIDASCSTVYTDRADHFFKAFHSDQRILERRQEKIEGQEAAPAVSRIIPGGSTGLAARLNFSCYFNNMVEL
jgi:hypothetical protein